MQFSIYPWDIRSWRSAFHVTGLPGIALLLILLGAMLQVEDLSGGGAGHSSATAILLIRTPAIVLAFLLLLFKPKIAPMRSTDLRFAYAAFAGLYLVSTLWSHIPVQTLGKSAELLLAGIVFFESCRGDNPIVRIEGLRQITLLTMATLGALAVVGFCLRLPAYVQHRPGLISSTTAQAPFLSGNGTWICCECTDPCKVLAEWQAHRITARIAIGQLLFSLALFSVSASRTSFGILLFSILLVVFKRSKLIGVLAVTGVLIAAVMFSTEIVTRLQGHQDSSSFVLSGRTVVWTAAVRQFERYPLLGVGGGVGGKMVIANIGNMYLEEMSSLHNGFLEVLTGLGLVGFLIGCYMLVVASFRFLAFVGYTSRVCRDLRVRSFTCG